MALKNFSERNLWHVLGWLSFGRRVCGYALSLPVFWWRVLALSEREGSDGDGERLLMHDSCITALSLLRKPRGNLIARAVIDDGPDLICVARVQMRIREILFPLLEHSGHGRLQKIALSLVLLEHLPGRLPV